MHYVFASIVLVGVFTWTATGLAQMTSTNYEIRFDSVGTSGSDSSSSASYQLRDSVGGTAPGSDDRTNGTYQLDSGYRAGIFDQVITFEAFAQSTASEQSASSLVGTTVTVGSTAGYAVDDFIVVIQDRGVTQVSAVGQVISLTATTLTVDEFADGGVAPTVDGTDDFVYRLAGTTANLGELSTSEVKTAVVGFNVTAEVDGGYSIQVIEDGNLRSGGLDINDVADGAVSSGEEYGGRSSDTTVATSTFDTQDTAFTSSFQAVVENGSLVFEDRHFITLKASISGGTVAGSYAHELNFIASGNF